MKLNEGEMICNKCEGMGTLPSEQDPNTMAKICKKCFGHGKVDWLENILGKKAIQSNSSSGWGASSSSGIPQETLDKMSQHLADSIDKDIMETMINELEQKTNKMKAAAAVFSKMEGYQFDNGIIS